MAEAEKTSPGSRNVTQITLAAAAVIGEVRQQPDGRAAVMMGITAGASAAARLFTDTGKFVVAKTAGFVGLDGGRAYWDHSANAANYKKVGGRDFYLGRFVGDSTSAAVLCSVDFNCKDEFDYDLDLLRDPYTSAPVGTQALGGFLPPQRNGGALHLLLSATNEAQKVDALGVDTFSKLARAIIEFQFRVVNDGAGTVVDASLGIASGTHATDADAIANYLLVHLDANNTNINLQSKDGTTTVAATDTTTDYTEGALIAQRVEVWFDLRTPADPQCYVNGSLVLPASVFDLSAAANELRLFAHLEKTASTDAYELAIDKMCARLQE